MGKILSLIDPSKIKITSATMLIPLSAADLEVAPLEDIIAEISKRLNLSTCLPEKPRGETWEGDSKVVLRCVPKQSWLKNMLHNIKTKIGLGNTQACDETSLDRLIVSKYLINAAKDMIDNTK